MAVDRDDLQTTLDALILQENELTATAKQRLGTFVDVALDAIALVNTFVSRIPSRHFLAVGSQLALQKSAALAFLSYIRSHSVQGDFNCRQLIEFCSLTVYLIGNPDAHFTDAEGDVPSRFAPPKHIMPKAYQWIADHYPDQSRALREIKETINDTASHASVFTSLFLLDMSEVDGEVFRGSFFDNINPHMTRLNLLKLTHIILTVVHTIRLASEEYGGFEISKALDRAGAALEAKFNAHQASLQDRMPFPPG